MTFYFRDNPGKKNQVISLQKNPQAEEQLDGSFIGNIEEERHVMPIIQSFPSNLYTGGKDAKEVASALIASLMQTKFIQGNIKNTESSRQKPTLMLQTGCVEQSFQKVNEVNETSNKEFSFKTNSRKPQSKLKDLKPSKNTEENARGA